jgi:cell division septum initiation protein DivIVA
MNDKKLELVGKKIEELIVRANQLKKENEMLRKEISQFKKEEIKKYVKGILMKIDELKL